MHAAVRNAMAGRTGTDSRSTGSSFISITRHRPINCHKKRPHRLRCEDGDKQWMADCRSDCDANARENTEQRQFARLPIHQTPLGASPLIAAWRSLVTEFGIHGGLGWLGMMGRIDRGKSALAGFLMLARSA